MATKKKAAKPAKKTIAPKKPARSSGGAAKPAAKKVIAKKVVARKDTKPAKKSAKPADNKKATAKHPPAPPARTAKPAARPVVKPAAVIAKTPEKGTEIQRKPVDTPAKAEKPEIKEVKETKDTKTEIKKTEPVVPPPAKKPEPAKPVKVVIPEIKTKTVRKYEPEFTKSVLDQPENIQTGPTMRYSDAELGEFKELILKKLEQAKKELTYLQGLITRKDEMGGDETENRYMTMEDGSMSMEREQLAQMASRQINYIDHLEKALMRIENKTYGICRVTGKLIDKARLRAVPHATLSIEAKQMMNK